jgi:hypothetical protein
VLHQEAFDLRLRLHCCLWVPAHGMAIVGAGGSKTIKRMVGAGIHPQRDPAGRLFPQLLGLAQHLLAPGGRGPIIGLADQQGSIQPPQLR